MGTHQRKPLIGDGWLFQGSVCLWLFNFFANFRHLPPPILAIKNSQNNTSTSLYLQNRGKRDDILIESRNNGQNRHSDRVWKVYMHNKWFSSSFVCPWRPSFDYFNTYTLIRQWVLKRTTTITGATQKNSCFNPISLFLQYL